MNVSIAKPSIDEREINAVSEVLRSGWVSQGPKCQEFEEAVAGFIGVKHARAANSGTSALQLLLLALDVGPGDEVIVPAFTCVATLNPVEAVGATPVLVDIDLCNFALDPGNVRKKLTSRTKAIILVHLFGLAGPVEELASLAADRNLLLIEDAALSLGAKIHGRHVGSFGTAAFLSFHPRKMITTGEGGMVVTDSDELAARISALRNYGASIQAMDRHKQGLFKLPTYDFAGFNYKMTDIQAAVGAEQMRKLESMIQQRRRIAEQYTNSFSNLEWLMLPREPAEHLHVFQSYTLMLRTANDDIAGLGNLQQRLFRHLQEKGVSSV